MIPSSNSNLHEYKRTQEELIMCVIEKGSIITYFFSLLLWKCKITQLLYKIAWQFLKMLKIELPYDPAIPTLDNYPREMKTNVYIKIYT